jgi:hypothetical protein
MAIELHHLHPGHDDEVSRLKARFSAYSALQNSPFGADLLHKRAATLASQSKAHIAEAVKLDNQLKELINDGTGESKDSGGNGEA